MDSIADTRVKLPADYPFGHKGVHLEEVNWQTLGEVKGARQKQDYADAVLSLFMSVAWCLLYDARDLCTCLGL